MPVLLLPLFLVLATTTADHAIDDRARPAAIRTESPTFDPDHPPSWWLDKMQRPCTKTANRISC